MNTTPDIALLWTDLETTGLDYENDLILELAYQVTDFLGKPLTEPKSFITFKHNDTAGLSEVLNRYHAADQYVREMHLKNGLWNDVLFGGGSERKNFFETIGDMLDEAGEAAPTSEIRLAGSTVGFDKRFLETKYGEELPISYRVFDLSTLRPVFAWQDMPLDQFNDDRPTDTHRAADDIARDIRQWQGLVGILTQ